MHGLCPTDWDQQRNAIAQHRGNPSMPPRRCKRAHEMCTDSWFHIDVGWCWGIWKLDTNTELFFPWPSNQTLQGINPIWMEVALGKTSINWGNLLVTFDYRECTYKIVTWIGNIMTKPMWYITCGTYLPETANWSVDGLRLSRAKTSPATIVKGCVAGRCWLAIW